MIKLCYDKWYANKDILNKAIRELNESNIETLTYTALVQMVVRYILNDGDIIAGDDAWRKTDEDRWNEDIYRIDDGDYQGTVLFIIHRATYQPDNEDYLMTYEYYGSCSGCDTLQHIQYSLSTREDQNKALYYLCKDLVVNMVSPYEHTFDSTGLYDKVTFKFEEEEVNENTGT